MSSETYILLCIVFTNGNKYFFLLFYNVIYIDILIFSRYFRLKNLYHNRPGTTTRRIPSEQGQSYVEAPPTFEKLSLNLKPTQQTHAPSHMIHIRHDE